jgi:transcription elongation GreA/GreB family factor
VSAAKIAQPAQDGELEIGERVTVLDLETGATLDYRVVAPRDAAPATEAVSSRSALGAALLGSHVGDIVDVALPSGTIQLEIVELDG